MNRIETPMSGLSEEASPPERPQAAVSIRQMAAHTAKNVTRLLFGLILLLPSETADMPSDLSDGAVKSVRRRQSHWLKQPTVPIDMCVDDGTRGGAGREQGALVLDGGPRPLQGCGESFWTDLAHREKAS